MKRPTLLPKIIRAPFQFVRMPQVRDHRPPADSPGALVHVGERRVEEISFRIFDYSEQKLNERTSASLEDCLSLDDTQTPTWLQVVGLHDTAAIGRLLGTYGIHPLVQDDVLNTNHRVKVEDFEDYVFVAVKELVDVGGHVELRHLSLILGRHVVISFQEAPSTLFMPIETRLRSSKSQLRRRGPDYLLWAILDSVADHYRLALDLLSDEVERLDDAIEKAELRSTGDRLHGLKRELDHFYRSLRPLREIATSLKRLESGLMESGTGIYWSDLQDHAHHATESAELLRETIVSLRDLHLSALTQRMNEAMRVLTAFATIFLPLTFIAGIYGMNFKHMPELGWRWAYPAVWVMFVLLAVGMFTWFRKRKWL